MTCPECGQAVTIGRDDTGEVACTSCGWGGRPTPRAGTEPVPVTVETWFRLLLLWAAAIAIVAGPFVALVWGFPATVLELTGGPAEDATPALALDVLHPAYWIAMALYVVVANVFDTRIYSDDILWFGLDDPFSGRDLDARYAVFGALLLIPGKIVAAALVGTVRVLSALPGPDGA